MDQTQTYSVETYHFPLSVEDDKEISRMLRERGVFAPSFVPQEGEDVYDPLLYRRQDLHHETKTIILADRNVVTRWLALLSGRSSLPEDRLAAAVMVFAQSANILVEPNLALYEATVAGGSEAASENFFNFEWRTIWTSSTGQIWHWDAHKNYPLLRTNYQLSLMIAQKSISKYDSDDGHGITSFF